MAHLKKFEHLKIQLDAIISATNNFADESCIGSGGFGRVYKGTIAGFDGHPMVALKRLDRRRLTGQGNIEFWKEIMMLPLYKHDNIVSLLGFCDDCGEKILVYEYVPNKSLDYYLASDNLRWIRRLKICIGAARGLAYLHSPVGTQERVLHRDIKSSNILLDQDWNAKISDFGLAKFVSANHKYTFYYSNAVGTLGYVDPLYAETGLLTKESDVYSFGVVLFEVLCGRLCFASEKDRRPPLIGLARESYEQNTINEIVYGNIKHEIHPESLQVYAKIAYQCLKRNREERPSMRVVVEELETALSYQYVRATRPEDIEEYASSEGGGWLVVTIHEANNLEGKHPFVLLRVGDDIKRTTTIKNNRNPVWKETFRFTLEKPTKAILHLFVCSANWNVKLVLGDVEISVADVVKEKQMNNRYNIGNGRIHVELQWESSALPLKTKPKLLQFMSSVARFMVAIPHIDKSGKIYIRGGY
ncbi:putative protein kinase RLK-Pelle-DLSV family [Helianthus annuus]|nr:putative protein kinase RLK-Pelle-DLSV family [Helianthus annuus]